MGCFHLYFFIMEHYYQTQPHTPNRIRSSPVRRCLEGPDRARTLHQIWRILLAKDIPWHTLEWRNWSTLLC
jgi:hypothetical protein